MGKIRIEFYQTASGRVPVEDYLNSIHPDVRSAVSEAIRDIGQYGFKTLHADFRHILGKLWEIKIDTNRIFYVMIHREKMVLLHAYKKQSQKMPRRELKVAIKRLKEVLS